MPNLILPLFIFLVALVYASVGHGGASGYLAVMTLLAADPLRMSTSALVLNLFVAGTAWLMFHRAGFRGLETAWPFLLASAPAAFLGSQWHIARSAYGGLLAVALLAAAARLAMPWPQPRPALAVGAMSAQEWSVLPRLSITLAVGAGIGLLSGIVGVGGGIFLSPLLVLCGWATPKHAAAASAAFIVINSASGLAGRLCTGQMPGGGLWWLVGPALCGAGVGAWLGARRWSPIWLRRTLAMVLVIAAVKGVLHG